MGTDDEMDRMHSSPTARPRRATSYDVARAAGVAQSTVSRCFKDDAKISAKTRDHILKIASDMGYTGNALARSLITQRSNVVGVIVTAFTIRNNPELIYALGEALQNAGNSLFLMVVENDDAIGASLQKAMEYPLDGLICCAQMPEDWIRQFANRGVPMVFFNRLVDSSLVDCITLDHAGAGRRIAEALYRAGHRSVVCVRGPERAPVSQLRVNAFRDRMAEFGIGSIPTVCTDFSYADGRRRFLDLVGGMKRPDAVFCANDQLALGVIDACRFDLGWRIPEDTSIIGFDDIAEAGRPSYALTTVRQPIVDMAETAASLLLARIGDPDLPPRRIMVPGELIERSSARLANGSPPA